MTQKTFNRLVLWVVVVSSLVGLALLLEYYLADPALHRFLRPFIPAPRLRLLVASAVAIVAAIGLVVYILWLLGFSRSMRRLDDETDDRLRRLLKDDWDLREENVCNICNHKGPGCERRELCEFYQSHKLSGGLHHA